jgi:membrane protein
MRKTRFVRFFRNLKPYVIRVMLTRSAQQRLPGMAAEIAFNATLATFPATIALLTIIGMIGSSQETFQELSQQLSQVAPQDVLDLIQGFVQELSPASNRNLLSISFVAAIWITSGAVSSAMAALDQIHRLPRDRLRPFWKAKLVALGLTFGTILLLVLATLLVFVTDIVVKIVANQGGELVQTIAKRPSFAEPALLDLWSRLSMPIALGMVAIAFAFIYRFGPSRWQRGTPILPGAILATIFWAIFSGIFRLYVANFGNYNRVYGAVGAIVVLLLWLQLGALTMLIGAQLNVTVGEVMNTTHPPLAKITQNRQHKRSTYQHPKHATRNKPQQRHPPQHPNQQRDPRHY